MAARSGRTGVNRENTVKILAPCIVAVAAFAGAAAFAQAPSPSADAPAYSAGLCVLLDDRGEVIDARIAETSGDQDLDDHAVVLARKLQWSPPYPKAGWLGVRITLSQAAPAAAPPGSLPHCSAASDAKFSDAI